MSDSRTASLKVAQPSSVSVIRTRVRLSGSAARAIRSRCAIRSRRWVIEDGATLVASASWVGVRASFSSLRASRDRTAHSPAERSRSASCREYHWLSSVSYTHLRAHETRHDLVCRLLLETK